MANIAAHSFSRWVAERGKRKAAATLGVSPTTILNWSHGESKPDRTRRGDIERIVGIPAGQWDLADGVVGATDVPAPAPTLPSVADVPADATAKTRALAHMRDLEGRLAAAKASKLDVRQLALLDAAYSKAIAVYGRLSGELELTEAQVLRSPAWRRIENTIKAALEPHPNIAELLADALDALEHPQVETPE